MKNLILFFAVLLAGCGNGAHNNNVEQADSDAVGLRIPSKAPFVHFELLSQRGEDSLGNHPYVFILSPSFRSEPLTAEIIINNIQHSADICNGGTDTNHIDFPYIRYKQFDSTPARGNTWVFVSQRLIPTQTVSIKAWMDSVAKLFPNEIPDPLETHPLTIYKKKWLSTSIPAR